MKKRNKPPVAPLEYETIVYANEANLVRMFLVPGTRQQVLVPDFHGRVLKRVVFTFSR